MKDIQVHIGASLLITMFTLMPRKKEKSLKNVHPFRKFKLELSTDFLLDKNAVGLLLLGQHGIKCNSKVADPVGDGPDPVGNGPDPV